MKYIIDTKHGGLFEAIVRDNCKGTSNIYYQGTKDVAMWICAAMNNYESSIPMQKYIDSEMALRG